jgi:hypothetical protein
MAINSETEEARISGHGVTEVFVTLSLGTFSTPETYDPTTDPNTGAAGQKRLERILGAEVVDVNDSVDVAYDVANQNIRAASQDGTAAPASFDVTLRLVGEPST